MVVLAVLDVDYKIEEDIPVVYLFTRDVEGHQYIFRDDKFEPYFYIAEKDWDNTKLNQEDLDKIKYKKIIKSLRLLGESSLPLKIVTKLPKHVRDLKINLHSKIDTFHPRGIETYEADVLFTYRYLIDNGIKNGIEVDDLYFRVQKDQDYFKWDRKYCKSTDCPFSNPRILYIDIEAPTTMTRKTDIKEPIMVIGIYDSHTRQYHQFYWNGSRYSYSSDYIINCNSEQNMFYRFLEYLAANRPDIILSYTKYDITYMIERMKSLRIKYSSLSAINSVSIYGDRINIAGIEYVDLQEVHEKVEGGQRFQSLEYLAAKVLSYGKLKLPYGTIYETWMKDYQALLRYNLRDVLLIKNIDGKLGLVKEYLDPIRQKAGCKFNDAMYAARVADIYYLRLLHNKIALRTRTVEKVRRGYTGALVLKVNPGIYNNVLDLDFKSLYPSIIRTFNIGWNSFSGIGDIFLLKSGDIEYRYSSRERSWTVEILDSLNPILEENSRQTDEARKARNFELVNHLKKRRLAYKSIVNGIYGFYGYPGDPDKHYPASRLYSIVVAESISLAARTVMEEGALPIVKELGYEMVMADTDSMFILLKEGTKEEGEKLRTEIQNRLNAFIKDKWNVDPSKIILDIDEYFRKIIILAKKRYSGISTEGRKIHKGMEIVRRDQSDLTIETQERLLDMVMSDVDKKDIRNFVKEQIIKSNTYPVEKIGISSIVKKKRDSYPSAVVALKALEFANQVLKLDIEEGETFFYVYIKPYKLKKIKVTVKLPPKKIIEEITTDTKGNKIKIVKDKENRFLYSEVAGFREVKDLDKVPLSIDRNRMMERTVKNKVEDILRLLNISWDELLDETRNNKRSRLDYYR